MCIQFGLTEGVKKNQVYDYQEGKDIVVYFQKIELIGVQPVKTEYQDKG
jgi:hypothetical protein